MGNAVANKPRQEISAADPVEFGASLLEVISKAARDPAVDIDKMERLLQMQERVERRNAEVAFAEAFADMQPNLPTITMNGQIVHKGVVISEFSDWPNINKAITPVLHQFGFGLSFKPAKAAVPGMVAVTAILRHRKGHIDEATVEGPNDTSGAKNAPQSLGSSLTYYKRYGGVLVLNLTIEGEDDDGSSAAPKVQHAAPRDLPFPQGPAKNKTELKAKGREMWRDIEAVSDSASLDDILAKGAPLLEQIKAGLPDWWTGGRAQSGETYEGLDHVIARVRRDLNAADQAANYLQAG
jgi:hypothetical protein